MCEREYTIIPYKEKKHENWRKERMKEKKKVFKVKLAYLGRNWRYSLYHNVSLEVLFYIEKQSFPFYERWKGDKRS